MRKIKYYIDAEEVYPIYLLIKPRKELCDYFKQTVPLVKIPLDKLQWIRRIEKEYAKIQKYLLDICKEAINR